MDPPLQQVERHVDRREEEQDEDGHLHDRKRLLGAQPRRDARRPQRPGDAEQEAEGVEPEEIDTVAADLHAREKRHARDDGDHAQPADQTRDGVADHDPAALRRSQHQPAHEAGLEIAGDPEAGEDA